MPDTTPIAPIGAMLYTTPVKAIVPTYLPQTSGPVLQIGNMVVETVRDPQTKGTAIVFDGYEVQKFPPPAPGRDVSRYAISVAMIKTVINGEVAYKLAVTAPSIQGYVELQVHTFTKHVGANEGTLVTKSGYAVTNMRGFQIPAAIAAVVSVDLGDKDSFVAVSKNRAGAITLSSYESNFRVFQAVGVPDYTTWAVLANNALIDIEALKNFQARKFVPIEVGGEK